jgi:glycosyltransferase involved in cell wall biosynthesis
MAAQVRVLRVIARLNIGGPAIQAISLTRWLEPRGYHTVLVRGVEDAQEGTMDFLADELGVKPVLVSPLRRNPGWRDLRALAQLLAIVRRERPQIVHTHAAKGGTLGRLAALLAAPRHSPVLIHTFHGHSLTGYFGPRTARAYTRIERFLARRTDRLIAVSNEVRDELVALGVAPDSKFEVVPLGFDLSPFTVDTEARDRASAALRAELGIPADARLVTLIARLVPIKRVDRFLRVALALREQPSVRFLIVGDGELRQQLRASAEARSLGDAVLWAGFRRDMPSVCFASEVVVLTSDNEGTPVSLIEAQAAGVPVVGTRVGGAASVVLEGETGFLASPDQEPLITARVVELLTNPDRALQMGRAGQRHVLAKFGHERLIAQLDRVYRDALRGRSIPSETR